MNIFYIAFQNTKRKPFRSFITVISISFLVAFIIFALFFVVNVNKSVEKASQRLGADIIVVPSGARTAAEEFLLESKKKTFYMDKSMLEKINELEEVERTTYHVYLKTVPGVCCDVTEAMVVGFDPETDFIVKPWLEQSDVEIKDGDVILGKGAAEDFGYGLLETKILFYQSFKVAGVLEETGTGMDHAIFVRIEDMAEIIRDSEQVAPEKISVIFVKLREGYDPKRMARKIDGLYPQVDAIARGNIGEGVKNNLRDINRIFTLSLSLSFLFATLLSWAIFSAIVNERKKEIGVLRAVGAKKVHIFKLLLIEAMILGIFGGFIGLIFGNILVNHLLEQFTLFSYISMGIFTSVAIGLISFSSGIFICLLGAFAPIYRAVTLEPLAAIKENA